MTPQENTPFLPPKGDFFHQSGQKRQEKAQISAESPILDGFSTSRNTLAPLLSAFPHTTPWLSPSLGQKELFSTPIPHFARDKERQRERQAYAASKETAHREATTELAGTVLFRCLFLFDPRPLPGPKAVGCLLDLFS